MSWAKSDDHVEEDLLASMAAVQWDLLASMAAAVQREVVNREEAEREEGWRAVRARHGCKGEDRRDSADCWGTTSWYLSRTLSTPLHPTSRSLSPQLCF